jgi:type I restriction enzyme, S subunit
MSDDTLFEIPNSWIWTKLDDIGTIAAGGTPSTKIIENFGGEIPWLTPADLSNFNGKYIHRGNRNLSEKGLNSSSAKLLPKGTIVFSSRAPIGYVAIASNPISTNQGFKNLILTNNIFNEYVFHYLKGNKELAESLASGTTFLELSARRFSQIPIPIPPFNEQKQIINKVEELFTKLDAGIQELTLAKEKLKIYRQSVLKNAFEGKLTEKWREDHKDEIEPAHLLLKKVEKTRKRILKKKYVELEIDSSKLPTIPETWVWTRFENITDMTSGRAFKKS